MKSTISLNLKRYLNKSAVITSTLLLISAHITGIFPFNGISSASAASSIANVTTSCSENNKILLNFSVTNPASFYSVNYKISYAIPNTDIYESIDIPAVGWEIDPDKAEIVPMTKTLVHEMSVDELPVGLSVIADATTYWSLDNYPPADFRPELFQSILQIPETYCSAPTWTITETRISGGNQAVVELITSRPINTPAGWSAVAYNKSFVKTHTQNGDFSVLIQDNHGFSANVAYSVTVLDDVTPTPAAPPEITVTGTHGAMGYFKTDVNYTANFYNAMKSVTVNGGAAPASGTLTADGFYRIVAIDEYDQQDEITFTIDKTSPIITEPLTYSKNGETHNVEGSILRGTVTFNIEQIELTPSKLQMQIHVKDGMGNWNTIGGMNFWNTNSGSAGMDTSVFTDGEYRIQIISSDYTDHTSQATAYFKIDNTNPLALIGAHETTDPTPLIVGTVDEPLKSMSITVEGITYPAVVLPTQNIYGTFNWSAKITNALTPGTYDITISATDLAGNSVDSLEPGVLIIKATSTPVTPPPTNNGNTPRLLLCQY